MAIKPSLCGVIDNIPSQYSNLIYNDATSACRFSRLTLPLKNEIINVA